MTILSASLCDVQESDVRSIRRHARKAVNIARNLLSPAIGVFLAITRVLLSVPLGGVMDVERVTERVKAEFEEMPGMTLTMPQASKLFGIECETCKTVVERLITTSYLRWTDTGAVTRATR